MNFQKISLFFLRVFLGGLFFYAGITKVLDPSWTAAGYLKGAKNIFRNVSMAGIPGHDFSHQFLK